MTRTFAQQALRAFAMGAAIVAAPLSAQAALTLTIPTNALQANAVQAFSDDGLASFDLVGITVKPLGNATAVANVTGAFNLPVTSISLQLVKVAGGSSAGSALEFNRINDETGEAVRVTLANFRIDFNSKKVLADATQKGKATVPNFEIYNFHEKTSLAFKYQFPLSISGKQVLDQLFLTPAAQLLFREGLQLPDFTDEVLKIVDFGVINIDVAVKLRSRPISSRPYVVAP